MMAATIHGAKLMLIQVNITPRGTGFIGLVPALMRTGDPALA